MEFQYQRRCRHPCDINEHLPVLYKYTTECESVFETGVRGVTSSWAFAWGLVNNNSKTKKLVMNDIDVCDTHHIEMSCKELGVSATSIWENNLELNFEPDETFDLTFIDTWHVYGQLKRELEKFSKITNKYIIMHDTTVDEWAGETVRWMGGLPAAIKQSEQTGFHVDEIMKGLWPAVDEFVSSHPEWVIHERLTNNNGLTILKRVE
tara:strand:- start:1939 stop:2559 length:621 start_codon:yes stop_codon:yes gene_type:complete